MNVLILTPLALEYDAVVKHLTGERETIFKDQANYEKWGFKGKHHQYTVIVQETGIKNLDMALAAERAIQSFKPQIALLIGIAGGVRDVKIGDVVVARSAFHYDSGKESESGFLPRPAEYTFSKELLARAQALSRNPAWKRRTADGAPNAAIIIGPIAAGDKVVAGTNNSTFQSITQHLSHIKALEMEAGGFGLAIQPYRDLHALVIRGISDLCAGKAETDQQNWQLVAAERAAAFGFELLWELDEVEYFTVSKPIQSPEINEKPRLNIYKDNLEDLVKKHLDGKLSEHPSLLNGPATNVTYNFYDGNHQHNSANATGLQHISLNNTQVALISELISSDNTLEEAVKKEVLKNPSTPEKKAQVGTRIRHMLQKSAAWLDLNSESILKDVSAAAYYDAAKYLLGILGH